MYNVFTDFHHASLLQSLILLFEKRLGGMIYRPIGRRWYDEGFWNVYQHPATVTQFLDINGATPDGTRPLNQIVDTGPPGVYQCHDIDSDMVNRAITLEYFEKMPFDFVLATIPSHIEPFKRLIAKYKPEAKLIFQIGNAWTTDAGTAPNVMASARIDNVPAEINFVEYHQEFDLDIFRPQTSKNERNILSFINVYDTQAHFQHDWRLFETLEKLLPEWQFASYGGQCRDGAMHGTKNLAKRMSEARFVWHVKAGGDGYGHVIHNAYAMGIPPIVKQSYYAGKLAGDLMEDGTTCINIDGLNPNQIITKIEHYNQNDRYETMRQNVYNVFKQKVDFDRDAENIKRFLANAQ